MRNISFALTEPQLLDGSKTVTRRLGWSDLKPGARLMACRKCMGLKRGETIDRLGEIEVIDVRREPLDRMWDDRGYGASEARSEGFPNMSGPNFVRMFCNHMDCEPGVEITRIAFVFLGKGGSDA